MANIMAADKGKEPGHEEQKRRPQGSQFFNMKPETERKEGVPVLRYGKGNNFFAFQQALYRRALRDYGDLAKLITLNKHYKPTLERPDFTVLGLSSAEVAIL